jgi:ligand-binding sensor domain-containing protein
LAGHYCLVYQAALLLLTALSSIGGEADVPGESSFLVASWHTEHGLPDGNITSLAQTPDGYLWVGTFKGLARFDGVRFTTFDEKLGGGFLGERITALLVDSKGKLWVAGETGALGWLQNGRLQQVNGLAAGTDRTIATTTSRSERTQIHSTHSRSLRGAG